MADWEVRWRPAAETDLQRHAVFITEDNVSAPVGLIDVAEPAVECLALHVLDIPDDYKFMDPELIEELERAVGELRYA